MRGRTGCSAIAARSGGASLRRSRAPSTGTHHGAWPRCSKFVCCWQHQVCAQAEANPAAPHVRSFCCRYCEHNPNKDFASCSVPQELTNEEIDAGADAEDGDSDSSDVSRPLRAQGCGAWGHGLYPGRRSVPAAIGGPRMCCKRWCVCDSAQSELDEEEALKRRRIPAVWQCLKENALAHRKRKQQDEDDIMICHCKPPWRGGDCCGPDCINRMLCIECMPVRRGSAARPGCALVARPRHVAHTCTGSRAMHAPAPWACGGWGEREACMHAGRADRRLGHGSSFKGVGLCVTPRPACCQVTAGLCVA